MSLYLEESDRDSSPPPLCEVCSINPLRYKCPGCSIRFCSCDCCKKHKSQTGCTGKRNRTPFVPIDKFGDSELRNDFHFLEDTLQTKYAAQRSMRVTGGNVPKRQSGSLSKLAKAESMGDVLAAPLSGQSASSVKLLKGARQHGVDLSLVPTGMSKRKLNTTRYRKDADKILWRVHVIFIMRPNPAAPSLLQFDLNGLSDDGTLLGVTAASVDEETQLQEVIFSLLNTSSDELANRHHLRSLRAGKYNLRCLVQKIPSPASNPVYYEVPLTFTLKSALEGKRVIEFPTFVVGSYADTCSLNLFVQELTPNSEEGDDSECVSSQFKRRKISSEEIGSNGVVSSDWILNESVSSVKSTEQEDDNCDEVFIKQLTELEGKDIVDLQKYITRMEQEDDTG